MFVKKLISVTALSIILLCSSSVFSMAVGQVVGVGRGLAGGEDFTKFLNRASGVREPIFSVRADKGLGDSEHKKLAEHIWQQSDERVKDFITGLKNPEFHQYSLPGLALIVGPEGVGKTALAQSIAKIAGMKIFKIDCKSLVAADDVSLCLSRQLRTIKQGTEATIVLLDDIDALSNVEIAVCCAFDDAIRRHNEKVMIIGTAISGEGLYDRIRTRMRFATRLDLPDYRERKESLQFHLEKSNVRMEEDCVSLAASKTNYYSHRELAALVGFMSAKNASSDGTSLVVTREMLSESLAEQRRNMKIVALEKPSPLWLAFKQQFNQQNAISITCLGIQCLGIYGGNRLARQNLALIQERVEELRALRDQLWPISAILGK